MKKAASTTAAKKNINSYFDKMAVGVGEENTREAQKNKVISQNDLMKWFL